MALDPWPLPTHQARAETKRVRPRSLGPPLPPTTPGSPKPSPVLIIKLADATFASHTVIYKSLRRAGRASEKFVCAGF